MQRQIHFTLNGKSVGLSVDDERMLLWVLRSDLGLTGTKYGCGQSLCGACTVLLDDEAVRACATPMKEIQGKKVTTIEGLARDGRLHPLQEAFVRHNAFQCGYCTPGMILTAYALLLRNSNPSDEDIISHMEDNLCRCGSHQRIIRAIKDAAREMRGGLR
ncbi:MAG: (2Fe-2S)-binding protein [bacterium]